MWLFNPPMYAEFVQIWRQPYVINSHDCSNKAGRYARVLRDVALLDAVVLVMSTPKGAHAIVEVKHKGKWWYCDPTSGKCTKDIDDHGTLIHTLSEHDLYASLEYR